MNFLKMLLTDLNKLFTNKQKEDFAIYSYRGMTFKWVRVSNLNYTKQDANRKCYYMQKVHPNFLYRVDYSY